MDASLHLTFFLKLNQRKSLFHCLHFFNIYIYVCMYLAKNEELKDKEIPLHFNFFLPLMIIINALLQSTSL